MKKLNIKIYKGSKVAVIQETEQYLLVSFLPDIENGLFSVKHEDLSDAPYLIKKQKK